MNDFISLDNHGQPTNLALNKKRNTEKAFENLLGLVKGVQADVKMTDGEIFFLQNWLSNQTYLANDPDVIDFLDALDSILEDGVITREEKDDLGLMLDDFLEYRDQYVYYSDDIKDLNAAIKRATGVFAGIAADEVLSEQEVKFLNTFINNSGDAKHHWPLSAVHKVVKDALKDGYVSGAEKELILMYLHDAVGGAFSEDGAASGKTTRLPIDDIDDIIFVDKTFCITGALTWGTRSECHDKIRSLGGNISKSVTLSTDYLVLGPVSSRDWFNSSYGRKIEKAVEYRDVKKTGINLITEELLVNSF